MDFTLEKRYFTLPRREIAYLRFVLESYDGLAFARTLDPQAAVIEVAWPVSRRADAEALLAALQSEISLAEVPLPAVVLPL